MSYTNSTPNLHLPQYIATDKPTYLGDWNASMQTIDTVITSTQATANGASSTATSALSTAQTAQQSANSANSKADTNATDIQNLNNNMMWKTISFSPIENSGITSVNITCYYNKIIGCLLGSVPSMTKPSNNVSQSGGELIPLFSTIGNIFNLSTGTITAPNNNLRLGYLYLTGASDDDQNIRLVKTYYDGANTIIYISMTTALFNSITWGGVVISTVFPIPAN